MTEPEPRFRVSDRTPPEHSKLTTFVIQEFVDGRWRTYMFDYMPVTRPTREAAQALADKLERGESVAEDQKRGPGTKSWRSPVK